MVLGVAGAPGTAAPRLVGMAQPQDEGYVTARPRHTGGRSAKATQHKLLTALNDTVQVSGMVCHRIVRNSPITLGNIVALDFACFCEFLHILFYLHRNLICPFPLPLVHGGWGSWSEWGHCSQTCDGGFQLRARNCDNPAPQYEGRPCGGSDVEERSCNTAPCPVDCEWEEWPEWSPCSASCEGGTQSRSRAYKQIALHGGKECSGSHFEQKECNQHKCPGKRLFNKTSPCKDCSSHKCFTCSLQRCLQA